MIKPMKVEELSCLLERFKATNSYREKILTQLHICNRKMGSLLCIQASPVFQAKRMQQL
jgi:hypothetical protein